MIKIENLYKEKTINEFLQEVSTKELISEFKNYLAKIVIVGVKIEGDVLGRSRYLEPKTTELVIEFIELFGNEFPEEMIQLLSEQEYTLRYRVCERFNLFKYIVEKMDTVQKLKSNKVYNLVAAVLNDNSEQIYGKKVYSSVGNRGNTYSGFMNELYSNEFVESGVFGVDFRLHIEVFHYELIELGRKLGVTEEVLVRLEKANENTQLLDLPKNRNTASSNNEQEFKEALVEFCNELNQIFNKKYPEYKVKQREFFETRSDVDTDFYISFEKKVFIQNDYEAARSELINTIKTLNQIENKYFPVEDMHRDLVEFYKERTEQYQPLFGV